MPKLNHDKNVCEVTGMGFHPAVAFGFQNWKWTLLLLRLACVSPAGMSFDFEQLFLEGWQQGILMLKMFGEAVGVEASTSLWKPVIL